MINVLLDDFVVVATSMQKPYTYYTIDFHCDICVPDKELKRKRDSGSWT